MFGVSTSLEELVKDASKGTKEMLMVKRACLPFQGTRV